ncbi:hypothetical protein pipiens_000229, partial [Culex pipiens pipiens]
MNPHYHPYPDLGSSPHSPSPDNANYPGGMVGGPHHNGHGPGVGGPQGGGGGGGGGGNPMGVSQMDSQAVGGFHGMNNGAGPVKHCAGCGGKITERFFLHALDRYWHNNCLKCSCCGAMLADIGSSCYTRSGMILCKGDYSSCSPGEQCSSDQIPRLNYNHGPCGD